MSALLCACEDGKRCADCERIEQIGAFRRNMRAECDRMAAEADARWHEELVLLAEIAERGLRKGEQ